MAFVIGDFVPVNAATLEGNDALGQPISTATQTALDTKLESTDLNTLQVQIDKNKIFALAGMVM